MTGLAALLAAAALAQAGSPCDDPAATAARWEDAAAAGEDPERFIAREVPKLAPALLLQGDPSRPTAQARAALAGARLPGACALGRSWRDAAGTGSPDRALLSRIFDRPEFAQARSPKGDTLNALVRWLWALLLGLFEKKGAATFVDGTRALVLSLAIAALLAGALRVATLRRGKRASRSAGHAPAPLVLADPAVHLGRARAALASDGREAIREALLALLSTLERRRWARPDRVKTNRELARELPERGAPPGISAEVERIAGWYDRTFYSLEPVAQDEARRFVDEIAALEGRLPGGAG